MTSLLYLEFTSQHLHQVASSKLQLHEDPTTLYKHLHSDSHTVTVVVVIIIISN